MSTILDETLQAVAEKIRSLWQNSTVYATAIAQNAPDTWHIAVTGSEQKTGLSGRQYRTMHLRVRYYLPQGGAHMPYSAFEQGMLTQFSTLQTPEGVRMYLNERKASPDAGEGFYQFTALAQLSYLPSRTRGEDMHRLTQTFTVP